MHAFNQLALKLRPELATRSADQRFGGVLNVFMVLYTTPLVLLGLGLMVWQTPWAALISQAGLLVLLFALTLLSQWLPFSLQFQVRPGVIATTGGNLGFIISISAVFILGPAGYWLSIIAVLIHRCVEIARSREADARWSEAASLGMSLSGNSLAVLLGAAAYQWVGATFPLTHLGSPMLGGAVLLLLSFTFAPYFLMFPLFIYLARASEIYGAQAPTHPAMLLAFIFVSSALPNLALIFTLLAAIIYHQMGSGYYLFFLLSVVFAGALASALTRSVEQRTQRARELTTLEALGRAIITAPPEGDTLADIFQTHLRGMMPFGRLAVWLDPARVLYHTLQLDVAHLPHWQAQLPPAATPHRLLRGPAHTLDGQAANVLLPIQADNGTRLGGLFFSVVSEENGRIDDYLSALQALAAQVASAQFRAEKYAEALLQARMANELEVAGRIQANLLPRHLPTVPGYELAASLTPARQTSGDFYDFIPLPNGRLGFLVADVTDKGSGAALFMALTRTLLRTFATMHPEDPARVLALTNQRLHEDAQAALFVTLFYAVLDPAHHQLLYINAGHNPAFLYSATTAAPQSLRRMGMPLGVAEDATWPIHQKDLSPGDLLVVYTDGVTEAQNLAGEFFEEPRLHQALEAGLGQPGPQVHAAVLAAVQTFVGAASPSDDLTLLVLRRTDT